MTSCPCCELEFELCCRPLIKGLSVAKTPEELMRSRYSAFVLNEPNYLFNTSSVNLQNQLSVEELRQSCLENCFVKLEIVDADSEFVEFKAFYIDNNKLGALHEQSKFKIEDNVWKYDTGKLIEEPTVAINRNSPCPCNSGKKFKKCHMK